MARSRPGIGGVGAALLILSGLVAAFAPVVAPYDPDLSTGVPFEPPSGLHWLGTNDVGQDIVSEVIWGGRVSLTVGVAAATVGVLLGTVAGVVSGYFGGGI